MMLLIIICLFRFSFLTIRKVTSENPSILFSAELSFKSFEIAKGGHLGRAGSEN